MAMAKVDSSSQSYAEVRGNVSLQFWIALATRLNLQADLKHVDKRFKIYRLRRQTSIPQRRRFLFSIFCRKVSRIIHWQLNRMACWMRQPGHWLQPVCIERTTPYQLEPVAAILLGSCYSARYRGALRTTAAAASNIHESYGYAKTGTLRVRYRGGPFWKNHMFEARTSISLGCLSSVAATTLSGKVPRISQHWRRSSLPSRRTLLLLASYVLECTKNKTMAAVQSRP